MDKQPAPRRRVGRPATGVTPKRNVRIGDVWDRCAALAQDDGQTMTALVEQALIAEEQRRLRERARRDTA